MTRTIVVSRFCCLNKVVPSRCRCDLMQFCDLVFKRCFSPIQAIGQRIADKHSGAVVFADTYVVSGAVINTCIFHICVEQPVFNPPDFIFIRNSRIGLRGCIAYSPLGLWLTNPAISSHTRRYDHAIIFVGIHDPCQGQAAVVRHAVG